MEGTVKKMENCSVAEESIPKNYGVIPTGFIRIEHANKVRRLEELHPVTDLGQRILVRARLHNVRGTAKTAFLILRDRHHALQAVLFANPNEEDESRRVTKEMVKWAANQTKESIVDVGGELVASKVRSELITFKTVELRVDTLWVVGVAGDRLPFQIDDAARPEEPEEIKTETIEKAGSELLPRVNLDTRLNHRVVDLRTPANQAIFRIQSGIMEIVREFLQAQRFMEIHTPKLISAASEGGANVFRVSYFKSDAYLAQSPQFYKQMAICADFDRVYEVGPVFRAENSFTHRHMTEFTGLDLEMAFKQDYGEVIRLLAQLLLNLFRELPRRFSMEIAAVRAQYPSSDFALPEGDEPLILEYRQGVAMLREAGVPFPDDYADLSTEQERRLGQLVRERYGTDFYVLDKYPLSVRPFYTMPSPTQPGYSHSYDFFMRGEEVMSGAQRIHDPILLESRARHHGIDLTTIAGYLESFRYGVPPHAGGGFGLERVLMLYLDLKNIRKASMFPRDPHRITP